MNPVSSTGDSSRKYPGPTLWLELSLPGSSGQNAVSCGTSPPWGPLRDQDHRSSSSFIWKNEGLCCRFLFLKLPKEKVAFTSRHTSSGLEVCKFAAHLHMYYSASLIRAADAIQGRFDNNTQFESPDGTSTSGS